MYSIVFWQAGHFPLLTTNWHYSTSVVKPLVSMLCLWQYNFVPSHVLPAMVVIVLYMLCVYRLLCVSTAGSQRCDTCRFSLLFGPVTCDGSYCRRHVWGSTTDHILVWSLYHHACSTPGMSSRLILSAVLSGPAYQFPDLFVFLIVQRIMHCTNCYAIIILIGPYFRNKLVDESK